MEGAMYGEKEQTLREVGLITGPEFSAEYSVFIEGLTDNEVKVLVELKRRLDAAGIPTTTFEMSGPIL
jgi:hypothetical protein